jgi:hypothetical protein
MDSLEGGVVQELVGDEESLCSNSKMLDVWSLLRWTKGFENVKIHLDLEPFGAERMILMTTFKLKKLILFG